MKRKQTTQPQSHLPGDDVSYRGYIIRIGLVGDYFIGKGGFWVACVTSMDAAKQAIDELID